MRSFLIAEGLARATEGTGGGESNLLFCLHLLNRLKDSTALGFRRFRHFKPVLTK